MSPSPLTGLPRLVVDLCRLRRGPQDLPHSPSLLIRLAAASIAVDLLAADALDIGNHAIARVLLSTGLMLALCWGALAVRRLEPRYVQTATALLACGVVMSLLQWAAALLLGPLPVGTAELSDAQLLFGWLMIALSVWQLAINAHVMRHALEVPFTFALLLVFIWVVASWALDRAVFGVG